MMNTGRYWRAVGVGGALGLLMGCVGPAANAVRDDRPMRVTAPAAPVDAIAKPAPALYVVVDSVADRSSRSASTEQRRERATSMRSMMVEGLQASPAITLAAKQARELSIPRFTVDATIERMEQRVRGNAVEISCELRVAVSDQRGKMLFFLTNGAAVRVPLVGFRAEFESPLQRDALEGAARGLNADLVTRLEAESVARARGELGGYLLAAE